MRARSTKRVVQRGEAAQGANQTEELGVAMVKAAMARASLQVHAFAVGFTKSMRFIAQLCFRRQTGCKQLKQSIHYVQDTSGPFCVFLRHNVFLSLQYTEPAASQRAHSLTLSHTPAPTEPE